MGKVLPFTSKKKRKQTRRKPKYRLPFIFLFLTVFLLVIAGHLISLQVLQAEKLNEKAKQQHIRQDSLLAKRGIIADRNGHVLAQSLEVASIGVSPLLVKNPEKTAKVLSRVLHLSKESIAQKIAAGQFFYLARKAKPQLTKKVKKVVKKEKLTGVEFEKETKRFYPYGKLAANVLGFAGIDNIGLEGLEFYYNQRLTGYDGKIIKEQNDAGQLLPGGILKYKAAKNGSSLLTTLDKEIQYKAQVELEKAVKKWQAKAGWLILMEVPSGEILALVSLPTYNSNKFEQAQPGQRFNKAISATYEPGSTMKMVTIAAGLEEGKFNAQTSFFLPGTIKVDGFPIKDAHPRAAQNFTVADILVHSSNVGAATLSQLLGKDIMYKYIKTFGINKKTGIDLPGEGQGLLLPKEQWANSTLATVAYGQGISATAIQMVRAAGIIANDGQDIKPHLGKALITPRQKVVSLTKKSSRYLISKATAKQLRQILQRAVEEGTGKSAQIKGYSVAGKTGTATKAINGRYEAKYISSFVGMAPVNQPKLVGLVALDEPKGAYYGGAVAAPVFAQVMEFSLQKLGVAPDKEK